MRASDDQMVLTADDARVVVDVAAGGRISSLTFGEAELIWSGVDGRGDPDPMVWGLYPMVPFAGRISEGQFTFDGTDYALPQFHGGHAIHGYGFVNPWTRLGNDTIGWEFANPWPFSGRVTQHFDLTATALTLTMTVEVDERQPISIGWHPWFRQTNAFGAGELNFPARSMYRRDEHGMPGNLIPTPPGPWDDCFTDLTGPPSITWGGLTVTLHSEFDHWVVFNERDYGLCVEPQSGPPNEINHAPRVLEAGDTMRAMFSLDVS